MRPTTALNPDGPQNVGDAIAVAATPGARGVTVVCAGRVHSALDVQKSHTYRLDAFDSGDAGPVGFVEEGAVRCTRNWPAAPVGRAQGAIDLIANEPTWPRVEIVISHAGARGVLVDALVRAKAVDGLVLAGTGNGTLHHELEAAALRAQEGGIAVLRATRCASGRILPRPNERLRDAGALSPVKARIALMLELLGR
jgi:L-asparaginase